MTESTTEDLARFAASVKYENIPAPAREYCKDILLDTNGPVGVGVERTLEAASTG